MMIINIISGNDMLTDYFQAKCRFVALSFCLKSFKESQ